MVFIHPTWFEGTITYAMIILIPLILFIVTFIYSMIKENTIGFVIAILFLILFIVAIPGSSVIWHYTQEVPSVQEKIVTVDDWQPSFGRYWGQVDSADDLMLKTTDGELFGNEENFLFNKFNTRDILNILKPNGTYKIKYYGWREGYNNGIPNILSVEEVINETGCPNHHDISNYMNKRSIILNGDDLDGDYVK